MSTRRYAQDTVVPPDRSRSEIERTLSRYGAIRFMYGWEPGRAVISFEMRGRRIRFQLPLPAEDEFRYTAQMRVRTPSGRRDAHEQAVQQRWRALALVIKAKLEAVESGIVDFEREMLPFIVLPNNQTVGDWMLPQVEESYRSGQMPAMLPGAEESPIALPAPAEWKPAEWKEEG